MNKITVTKKNTTISFSFGKVKCLVGQNIESKDFICRTIKKHFFGIDHSEYDRETDSLTDVLIDEKPLDTKKWKMYEISDHYDIDADLKMGSKTIMLKYIEMALVNIEYDDTLQTINILFNELASIVEEKINQNELKPSLSVEFPELTTKFLIKNMVLNALKDDYKVNGFNLSVEELLSIQIKMCIDIARTNPLYEYLFIIDSNFISFQLMKLVEEHDLMNLHFIISTRDSIDTTIDNVVSVEKYVIDFANDVDIYNEILMNLEVSLSLDELKEELKLYVKKDKNLSLNSLTKLL